MAENRLSGKLAVILHADVAGSTALVHQDERLAHKRIQDAFQRFSRNIEKYHGQVHELRGDALLAEFERASDAVAAALAFQADQAYNNSRLPDDLQPTVRVGIALGEVVIADNTITGAGVVLAQRVEQLADAGGVCITAALHEAIPRRMPFDLADLGEQILKGFDDPVHVYRVELSQGESIPSPAQEYKSETSTKSGRLKIAIAVVLVAVVTGTVYWLLPSEAIEEPALVERMAFPLPDKPSIAVLPFTNMSDDPKQEYFVDGMTEDLITDLSQLSGLFVIARNSVFTYKDKPIKVSQVAEELGVRYVLEGSVRRVGNEVRINAQLIDALSGGHVWAERYDGSLSDIFELQDSVTEQIVTALALNLAVEKTVNIPTASTQAYDLFLKGWAHYQRHTADDSAKAVPYFEAAIRLDAKYAQAHAALAAVYWETWENRWADALDISLADAMKNAKTHLQEAMKEPSSLAHWVASNILIAEGNYDTAVIEAEQIVALDANNADGYAMLANALALSGKSDEGARLIEKAIRLNPNSSPLHAAAQTGDADAVRRLIAEQSIIDTRDYYGKTPLHIAAEYGQAEVAAMLIDAGADIEAKIILIPHQRYWTPLVMAALEDHGNVAELLIAAGADVDVRSGYEEQWTILHYTADRGQTDVANLLIENGADIEARTYFFRETPLFQAPRQGDKAMAELLISKGANVKATGHGNTLLHYAAISGNVDLAQLLLANGANANAKSVLGQYPGETPLHAAAYAGHIQVAELLLANGADINAARQSGYTPLYRGIELGDQAMVELLIKNGADITTRDTNGATPLHVVALTRHVAITELLITGGADINARDNSGFTPLDHAQGGDIKMIEALVRHGAQCTIC